MSIQQEPSMMGSKFKQQSDRRVVNSFRGVNNRQTDRKQPPRIGRIVYFQNFPPNWTAKNLWNHFSKQWLIGEVFIPAKAFKRNVRYGFLRIQRMSDCMAFLRFINAVSIGGFKLKGAVSIFSKPFSKQKGSNSNSQQSLQHTARHSYNTRHRTVGVNTKNESGTRLGTVIIVQAFRNPI